MWYASFLKAASFLVFILYAETLFCSCVDGRTSGCCWCKSCCSSCCSSVPKQVRSVHNNTSITRPHTLIGFLLRYSCCCHGCGVPYDRNSFEATVNIGHLIARLSRGIRDSSVSYYRKQSHKFSYCVLVHFTKFCARCCCSLRDS